MIVKLVRHRLPNYPDWQILKEEIPVGTKYEVIGYESKMLMINHETGRWAEVATFYLVGNNGEGYLPCELFESILNES